MGCCVSSNKEKKAPDHHHFPPKHELPLTHLDSRALPPCLEEETVKEVVHSETRVLKPKPTQQEIDADTHIPVPEPVTVTLPITEETNSEAKDLTLMNKHEEEISQASQVSEIYSISESFSTTTTATTTITETREDEAISKPTRRRSPAKLSRKRTYGGEISRGAKTPAKRTETSMGAGAATSWSAPGRTMPRNVRNTGVRRESGENGSSVRRSRSPMTRSGAGGVAGRSPGKVTGRGGGRLRAENEVEQLKEVKNDAVLEQRNVPNESFDNPHVSLECFIFL